MSAVCCDEQLPELSQMSLTMLQSAGFCTWALKTLTFFYSLEDSFSITRKEEQGCREGSDYKILICEHSRWSRGRLNG